MTQSMAWSTVPLIIPAMNDAALLRDIMINNWHSQYFMKHGDIS